jgi:hypothetical protein
MGQRISRWAPFLAVMMISGARGQDSVVERLDRLERQNQELLAEVRALRAEIAATAAAKTTTTAAASAQTEGRAADVTEQVQVQQARIEEHEQSKVESEHRMPVQLSGMLLFNAFVNGRNASGTAAPLVAGLTPDPSPLSGGTAKHSWL